MMRHFKYGFGHHFATALRRLIHHPRLMAWPGVVEFVADSDFWVSWTEPERERYREHLRRMGVTDDLLLRCYRTEIRGDTLRLSLYHEVGEPPLPHRVGQCDRPGNSTELCTETVDV
jgi:hypothetical protein